ncbi:MAG: outer membrane protein assembly factor BamA [Desulfobacterales bacterium]|nr:outer membrane protein assembly factor BamA [Desulfobacterales bacterium]
MFSRLTQLLIAIIFCFPTTVYSLEVVRVAVLPFEILSSQDFQYLQTEIPNVIKEQLKQQGAIIVDSESVAAFSRETEIKSADTIRNLGIKITADYVVWGSLTWIGPKFSLDAKMVESFGKTHPDAFFMEGENIENLLGIVKELSRTISMKLFKQQTIAEVLITGNKRIENDAIKRIIKTQAGDLYLPESLSEDLKAVYAMGYFDDVRIESENGTQGKIITFIVKEKPTIRMIRIKGNRVYDDEEIKENLDLKTGSILNIFKIHGNVKRIEDLYRDKNYHNVKVTYSVNLLEHNQSDLEFVIEEGEKLQIKQIAFIGNTAYTGEELKKMMKSSEKGFFSWLTSSGELNTENLNQDIAKISAFYHNNGYVQAKLGEPQIQYEGEWINITIKIDEGPQFKVGNVKLAGDLIFSEDVLQKDLKINKETFFNREVVRKDILMLTDLYSDEGYAYADISPRIDKNLDTLTVDITYSIEKGKQVYFEKIIIDGNTKTRDKVIRRELTVYEQELYSGKQLKRGIRNLYRLDYFEDIKVDTLKGSNDDQMLLKIDVKEKPTGIFSFGAGYSSVENVFVMGSIAQRNFLGYGQTLQLKAEIGGTTNRFTLSFTEPWLFDIPLSAGIDVYNWDRDYDDYDKNSKGGGIRFGYPIYDFTRAYLSYSYEVADISDIEEDAALSIWELEGINVTSSISASVRYDSRDRVFNPTEGQDHSFTVEYAGIGGDIAFTKYLAETGWYIPLFKGTVGFLHGKGGWVEKNSGGKLPDYEKFYLGGMNSLRGFDWRDICLTELNSDGEETEVGGNKFIQFNLEFIVPLIKQAGIVGVLFFDAGNVYGKERDFDFSNLRESAGFGFRWYSPMGPIRIENGYILDPEEGESRSGRWEFSMGSVF